MHFLLIFMSLGWVFIAIPSIGGFGAAWANLATREDAVPRRSPPRVWLAVTGGVRHAARHVVDPVAAPSGLPGREAVRLQPMADQVEAGQAPGFPRRAFVFSVAASALDGSSGNVSLMIDPNPKRPTGFVRVGPGTPPESRFQLIRGDELEVYLGGGWWYLEED